MKDIKMNGNQYEEEERLYRDYHRQLNLVEEERENIERELRRIEDDQSRLDDVFREIHDIFRELLNDCDGEQFAREMDLCEDKFLEYRRKTELEIEDNIDQLEMRRNDTYEKEEAIRGCLYGIGNESGVCDNAVR